MRYYRLQFYMTVFGLIQLNIVMHVLFVWLFWLLGPATLVIAIVGFVAFMALCYPLMKRAYHDMKREALDTRDEEV